MQVTFFQAKTRSTNVGRGQKCKNKTEDKNTNTVGTGVTPKKTNFDFSTNYVVEK